MIETIQLTSKYAESQIGIKVFLNRHNPKGWIETPKGQHLNQMPKSFRFWSAAKCKFKKPSKITN